MEVRSVSCGCRFEWNFWARRPPGWSDGLFLSLPCDCGFAAFSSHFVCVTPTLFVLFAPVFALVSPRCRFPSLCSSVFQFESSAVLFSILCLIALKLLRGANRSFLLFHLHRFPLPIPMSRFPLLLPPGPESQSYCILYKRV